jgi:hypothetical protein
MNLDDFLPESLEIVDDVLSMEDVVDISQELEDTLVKPEKVKKKKENFLFPVWTHYHRGVLLVVDEQGDYFLLNVAYDDFPVAYGKVRHNLESPEPLQEKLEELGIEDSKTGEKILWAKYALVFPGSAKGLTTKRVISLLKAEGK